MCGATRGVRFVPIADIGTDLVGQLFDHLIGAAEHCRRNCEAECFRGLEVDDQLELDRLRDGQVGRLGPFENPSGVDAGLSIRIGEAGAVTREAAGGRKIRKRVDAGHRVTCGQGQQSAHAG